MSTRMNHVVIKAVAAWTGFSAIAMAQLLAKQVVFLSGLRGSIPTSGFIVPALLGAASMIGLVGGWRLWRARSDGRLPAILCGLAIIVGMGPAAILRGDSFPVLLSTGSTLVLLGLLVTPVSSRGAA